MTPPQRRAPGAPASPRGPLARLWAQRHLILQLVRRDVSGRYKGSFGGAAWAVLTPMLMLAVYLFVFGVVFNPRRAATGAGPLSAADLSAFGISLFCGMLVHGLFSECLTRAPAVIVGQPAYVKRIVFPLEILPLVTVGAALFHFGVGLVVLLAGAALFGTLPGWHLFALPLVIVPLLLLSAGITWLFAALAVYLRDIGQLTGLLATVLLFLSPVFYPLDALPQDLRWLAIANPLSIPIEATRDLLLRARMPDLNVLAGYWAACAVVARLGLLWFEKTRRGFADVL